MIKVKTRHENVKLGIVRCLPTNNPTNNIIECPFCKTLCKIKYRSYAAVGKRCPTCGSLLTNRNYSFDSITPSINCVAYRKFVWGMQVKYNNELYSYLKRENRKAKIKNNNGTKLVNYNELEQID